MENLNLAEYFITSKAEKILSEKENVEVKKARGNKCERCWKILNKKCERINCPISWILIFWPTQVILKIIYLEKKICFC